jgi:outer membrane protein OmpA-like peptidoglycan-associated protein
MKIKFTIAFGFLLHFHGILSQNEIASFYFNVGKSEPTGYSLQELAKFKMLMQSEGNYSIEISSIYSYTDSTGSRAINDRLAHERLAFVRNYLNLADREDIEYVPATLQRKKDLAKVLNWRRVDVYFTRTYHVEAENIAEVQEEVIQQPIELMKEYVSDSTYDKDALIFNDLTKSVERNEPYILSINFVPGTFKMEQGSKEGLQVLSSYLFQHSDLNVIIRGHVCCENNKRASKKRAKAVVESLVEMGVDKRRLKAVGMSNSEPLISPERTESDRKKNRRVDAQFVSQKKR